MVETILKNGFRISISMETGDVIISTEDYHAGELVVDEGLANKMLAAAKRKTAIEMKRARKMLKAAKRKLKQEAKMAKRKSMQVAAQDGTIDDVPGYEVRLPGEQSEELGGL